MSASMESKTPTSTELHFALQDTTGLVHISSTSGERQQLSRQISRKEWDTLKPFIYSLYIEANESFPEVARALQRDHGFLPTKRQFTRKVGEWGFRKNASRDESKNNLQRVISVSAGRMIDTVGRKRSRRKIVRWQKDFRAEGESRSLAISSLLSFAQSTRDIPFASLDHSSTNATGGWTVMESDGHDVVSYDTSCGFRQEPTKTQATSGNSAVMELDGSWEENECVNPIASEDKEVWPFTQSAYVDIIGSPNLRRLFEALDIATSELPKDIESLTLPEPIVPQSNEATRKYISSSELVTLHGSNPSNHFSNDDVHFEWEQPPRHAVKTSFKPHIIDVLFPCGDALFPSPFNEVYPFPQPPQNFARRSKISMPAIVRFQLEEKEYSNKFQQLIQAFGETNPAVIETMKILASTYFFQGKYVKAEHWYQQVIFAQTKRNTPDSREILILELALISVILLQHRFREALEMSKRVHSTITATLNPEDPLAMDSLLIQSILHASLGNADEEEAIIREVVQVTLNAFGPKHRNTLQAISRLGQFLNTRDHYSESERLFTITLQLQYVVASVSVEDQCQDLIDLSYTLRNQNRVGEALKLCRKAVENAEIHLGDEHPTTMNIYYYLGTSLQKNMLPEESEEILRKCVELRTKVLGCENENTVDSMHELGRTLRRRGKNEEATEWLEKAFHGRLEILGPANTRTLGSCFILGECYENQGRLKEARSLYISIDEKIRNEEGDDHPGLERTQRWISWI